mgnify:CR=1 FL=1
MGISSGNPLNPSYFLYVVMNATNTTKVNFLTHMINSTDVSDTHPLLFLLGATNLPPAADHMVVDLLRTHPPAPLHVTRDVTMPILGVIAMKGLKLNALGEMHESRNSSKPRGTVAPVRWRNYGDDAADVIPDRIGTILSEVKAGATNRVPGGAVFDVLFTPSTSHSTKVTTYWSRYGVAFNAVAEAFEIPCELLVAVACKETSGGGWFDTVFANSHEMDTTRLEPLLVIIGNAAPVPTDAQLSASVTSNAAHHGALNAYRAAAGYVLQRKNRTFIRKGGPNGDNANIPVPWNGAANVAPMLTWTSLALLAGNYRVNVRISPGVMQTLVWTARADLGWIASIYGANYINSIQISINGVMLSVDSYAANLGTMFREWFGVTVDATGAVTTVAASKDENLTRMKRALHNIVAGAAHIKRNYNSAKLNRKGKRYNIITDFDLPTVGSGYNDGADLYKTAAAPGVSDDAKWRRLFAMKFNAGTYPERLTRFYNAAEEVFNSGMAAPLPSVRLWKSS